MSRARLTALAHAVLIAAIAALVIAPTPPVAASYYEPDHRVLRFPVEGGASYSNDFGAPRSGGRTHKGNDLFAPKMRKLLAVADGTVVSIRHDNSGLSGNMLTLRDNQGWRYLYIHINNDTPGTDDGANHWHHAFAPGIQVGSKVKAGDHLAYNGDSGNAENTSPHVHFEMHNSSGTVLNPWTSLRLSQGLSAGSRCRYNSNPQPVPSASSGTGYWSLGADGGVFTFGNAGFYGSTGGMRLNRPVIAMAPTKNGAGYWLLAGDGGIFSFGNAAFHGSTGGMRLNQPVVGIAATPTGKGYWLVAADGGIFSFGDAGFHGSTGGMRLNQPIVGIAPTKSGKGYWLVAADGGIFNFGDAGFHGSAGSANLNRPIRSITATPSGNGYWLLGAAGNVFNFGDAPNKGSIPGQGYCSAPDAASLIPSATGQGYWIQGVDGSVWTYGDAADYGAVNRLAGTHARSVGMARTP